MNLIKTERKFHEACEAAHLEVNGNQPRDPQVLNPNEFYAAFAINPYLAIGESFAAEHIKVEKLDDMIMSFAKAQIDGSQPDFTLTQKVNLLLYHLERKCRNGQKSNSLNLANRHYNSKNSLIEFMTGKWAKYTSGYWPKEAGDFDLDISQELSIKIISERLGLKEGMKVLDIGFGLGKISKYMIDNYGVHITGLTISREQMARAKEHCKNVVDKTNFILSDWQSVNPKELGKFDRVVNIEMIEHVGPKNYHRFFKFIYDSLDKEGSVLIQAINSNYGTFANNPFINKYIFPFGVTPKIDWMMSAAVETGLRLRLADNSLGDAYSNTLVKWWEKSEDALRTGGAEYCDTFKNIFPYDTKDNTFGRIWQFYLLSCAGGFKSGLLQDGQFLFEKNPANTSKSDIYIPKTRDEIDIFLKK